MSDEKAKPTHLIDIEELPKSRSKKKTEFLAKVENIPPGKALDATQEFPELKLASIRTRFYTLKRDKRLPESYEITQISQPDGKHIFILNTRKKK